MTLILILHVLMVTGFTVRILLRDDLPSDECVCLSDWRLPVADDRGHSNVLPARLAATTFQ